MAKSAQQKFNEYLAECRETTQAVNALVDESNEYYKGFAFSAGFLGVILQDAISELPKARRAALRDRLLGKTQELRNLNLAKKIKDSDIQRIFDPAGLL